MFLRQEENDNFSEDDVPEGEEEEASVDFNMFLENMKEEFLKSLNLSGVPSQERSSPQTLQFMIDLYNRYATDKSSMPASNIVRSFSTEDVASIPLGEKKTATKHILLFNLSIPSHEEVTMAELRLYTFCNSIKELSKTLKAKVAIYDLEDRVESETTMEPKLSLIVSKEINCRKGGWETFEVTNSIKRWIQFDKTNNIFEVHFQSLGDGNVKCESLHNSVDLDRKTAPLLVVFSDDRSNERLEAREELKQLIFHEQASELDTMGRNDTIDQEQWSHSQFSVKSHHISSRTKRSTGGNHCRKASLRVDFKEIGWDSWIVAPKQYDAFECKGVCYFPLTDNVTPTKHAIIQSLVHLKNPKKAAKACCVPTKLDSISVLYKDDAGVLTLKYKYEGMKVAECGCR
ncbi:growth/differentiation factor 2 [Latimeria chalumnae]|nr:PREDICTED: growth/differentiation factor 2 [Latimeria chalumnae]|eukprot:XP_005992508.2 PREDICTED: growth/differentiation factor 2 [Latimeria chalumnae]